MNCKLYVPLFDTTLNDETRPIYLEEMKKAKVDKLLIAMRRSLLFPGDHEEEYRETERSVRYFKENGLEVGVWFQAFGFGAPLTDEQKKETEGFLHITSVNGKTNEDAFCPEDEGFMRLYCDMVKKMASLHPDMLIIDDDLCLSVRPGIGCFCARHRDMLSEKLGMLLPENFAEAAFAGGENRYRSAWLSVMGDSLRRFCKSVRRAIDSVDPSMRAGFCSGFTSWDMEGADALELTEILAGGNKPVLRLSGAPYWVANGMNRFPGQKLHGIIEFCRVQEYWSECKDIELFSEGDVYPRPRYAVPNAWLGCYDAALRASGNSDSFKYMFDYYSSPKYETGYLKSHCKDLPLYDLIDECFSGKEAVGVRVYEKMRKTETMRFPDEFKSEDAFMKTALPSAPAVLASLGIPTVYGGMSECGIAFGNGADEITDLPKRLILDAEAAWLLQKRGIDTGMRSEPVYKTASPSEEYFPSEHILLSGSSGRYCTCDLNESAVVESRFGSETGAPATYSYRDGKTEFFVMLWDGYSVKQDSGVYCSYARQHRLLDFCSGFPSVSDHPGIYQLCKRSADETVSLFINICEDELFDFDIRVREPFSDFELFGVNGIKTVKGIHISGSVPAFRPFILKTRK